MTHICFYFQIHQPLRIRPYTVFDIGSSTEYFDDQANKQVLEKVAKNCYIPATKKLLSLAKKHKGTFKVSFSISGIALEQLATYTPDVIELLKELYQTGCVEFLSETYYHSLVFLYSEKEFIEQINLHTKALETYLGITTKPTAFRNTELIYTNRLAQTVESLGYKTILAEGADQVLQWKSPNKSYSAQGCKDIVVLLKNYKFSDDIAFRFSNKAWDDYPLTVEKFSQWLQGYKDDETINLFMDYETFGEHQWEDTGIFTFLEELPSALIANGNDFVTVSEASSIAQPGAILDVQSIVSWADKERDISAWTGNKLQSSCLKQLYAIEEHVKATKNETLLTNWRKLTTSDHTYYMSTKQSEDGNVHNYFSPYESPYDAFIYFMNVLNDIAGRANVTLQSEDGKKKELTTKNTP